MVDVRKSPLPNPLTKKNQAVKVKQQAGVAKLADAADSKSAAREGVSVQVRSPAKFYSLFPNEARAAGKRLALFRAP